jgi:hypothetical protein
MYQESMQIKDREMSQDLARDELSAVRGGSNFGFVGGHGLGSLVTAVNAAVNTPTLTQVDTHPVTVVDLNSNNVVGLADTLIGDFGLKKL